MELMGLKYAHEGNKNPILWTKLLIGKNYHLNKIIIWTKLLFDKIIILTNIIKQNYNLNKLIIWTKMLF